MNENFKSGFVAIIGRPNVGKSTLMNHLIGQKIAITSKKPQTTRNRIQTVYTCDEGQIVFLDTPGIHKAKNKLGEYMVQVAERTLKEVDALFAEHTILRSHYYPQCCFCLIKLIHIKLSGKEKRQITSLNTKSDIIVRFQFSSLKSAQTTL